MLHTNLSLLHEEDEAQSATPRYMKNERVMAYFGGQGLDMSDAARPPEDHLDP